MGATMKAITGFVGIVGLVAFSCLSLNTAYAQRGRAAGSMAHPNALSTTVYGTQAPGIRTNAGPIAGRPAFAISPNFPTAPVPRLGGTNSIRQTNALFGNTPYAGPQPPPGGTGINEPGWNGTGNPSGRLRSPSFSRNVPGPLLIPESLGNPEQKEDEIPTLNGPPLTGKRAAAYRATMDAYVRSISAYGTAEPGAPETSPPAKPQTGEPTLRRSRWPEWPNEKAFDVHSISAYGDLERAEEQKQAERQKTPDQKNVRPQNPSSSQPPATGGAPQPFTTTPPPSK
jgi:hypothetical protein